MDEAAISALLITLFGPIIIFFLFGINGLGRFENRFDRYHHTFRHARPNSYVKQNKTIRLVRNCLGMQTKTPVHWLIFLLHYLQIAMLISPIVMLIVFAFLPNQAVVNAFLVFGFALPTGLCGVMLYTLYVVLYFRSVKWERERRENSISSAGEGNSQ